MPGIVCSPVSKALMSTDVPSADIAVFAGNRQEDASESRNIVDTRMSASVPSGMSMVTWFVAIVSKSTNIGYSPLAMMFSWCMSSPCRSHTNPSS